MSGTPTKEEMGAKIQNAFYSVGAEEGFRRGFKRPDLEFKIHAFAFSDSRTVGPHNIDAFVASKKERDQIIEAFLNNGWWLTDKIICPPHVMLIFSREKEAEENERE